MSEKDVKKRNYKLAKRSYLARDFNSLKRELLNHARTFFPDQIDDFSETGLGGMFVDMLAYVGDSMSYYLDHQFNELSWQNSVELVNIKRHIKEAGVEIYGASPATAYVNIYIKLPYTFNSENKKVYTNSAMPIVKEGTQFLSSSGIKFNLMEDIDFSTRTIDGKKYIFFHQ